jgi:uncharacterized protein YndB with AHSA1/START domain
MEEMQFSIEINADSSRVWRTLWHDDTFREWASVIDPGTYMVGEIKQGSEVQFISNQGGYGVTSLVETVIPHEYVGFRHQADTQENGTKERTQEWTGGLESYALKQHGDSTTLTVTFDVPSTQRDYFLVTYPKALERIKTLSESS